MIYPAKRNKLELGLIGQFDFLISARLIIFSFFLALSLVGNSQENGSIELELGGVGGFGSVSYSKTFASKNTIDFNYRVGLSYATIDRNNGAAFIFPVMVHATYGLSNHRVDFGLGQAITVTTRGSLFARMPLSLGYKFDPMKRVYYRFAYTPIISYLFNFQWEHWGGGTFGFKLGKL